MAVWLALGVLALALTVILISYILSLKHNTLPTQSIPEHIWEDLKDAIPEADYNFLRSTKSYMGSAPKDLLARLNYIGAAHDPQDPKQVRIAVLELRLADQEQEIISLRKKIPNDIKIMWLAVSSTAGISSLVALIFFLLQQADVVQ